MMEIAKWNETFENADTRKRQRLGWLGIPTGCDSNGYLSLVTQDGGFEAFGIFLAICQWSATQPKHLRGKLARTNGEPLTEKDVAVRIRAEVCQVSAALKLLMSNDVGWIIGNEIEKSAGHLPVICQSSPDFVQGEGEGEGEGEVKEKGKDPLTPKGGMLFPSDFSKEDKTVKTPKASKAKPESQSELNSYFLEVGLTQGDAEYAWNHWESKGWKNGRDTIKDWKAAVRSWKAAGYWPSQKDGPRNPVEPPKQRRPLPPNWREIAQDIYGHPVTCSEEDLTPSQWADIYRQTKK